LLFPGTNLQVFEIGTISLQGIGLKISDPEMAGRGLFFGLGNFFNLLSMVEKKIEQNAY
jgi:hypothetical protein